MNPFFDGSAHRRHIPSGVMRVRNTACLYLFSAIVLIWSGTLVPATADDHRNIFFLHFSSSNKIDQDNISKRDRTRPFYFNIENLSARGQLPFTVDIGSDFRVWLDERTPKWVESETSSSRSLALALASEVDENVKDKVFFNAVPWKSNDRALATGDRTKRFISFDMNLATPYDTPKYWVIHFQAWQCCSGHPPFVMAVLPKESNADKITLELAIRNDESERARYGQEIQIAKFEVARNHWFHVAMELEPSVMGETVGKIRSWVNGKEIVDWRGHWGYAPTKMSDVTNGELKPEIGFDLGVYRRRQPGTQTVLIDNIRYGTSISSIDLK